tara:strand:- start:591 stop:1538 length:948 start_codon:yes stop_codon:yes gene_type:complete
MNLTFLKTGDAILNYHKIRPDKYLTKHNDELAVSVSKFKEQLTFLKRNYNLVSLEDFLNFKKSNKNNISITFDDGYKDNLKYALPILNELNVPATIYLVTKFFENEFSVWWYELYDFIWKNSKNIEFEYGEKKYDISIKNNLEKLKCFKKLREVIKKLNKTEQEKFLSALTKTNFRKQYKDEFLSKEDLELLNKNKLITIGAHTHNHLSLKNLEEKDCIKEISKSKEILEQLTNRRINHFSYPYGTKNDVGKREFKIVKELGFKSAVTTSVGKISEEKLFNLPRIHINEKTNERNLKIKLSIFYYFYKKFQGHVI